MKKIIINLFSLSLLALGIVSCQKPIPKPGDVVFKNVNVIPMTENKVLENLSVYVSDGKIKAVDKFEALAYPATTTILDARGKYLIPGLSDMHIHIWHTDERILFLANGVTLVRNMFGLPQYLEGRKKIRNRELLGPELFTTSPIVDGKNPMWPVSLVLDDPAKVKSAIKSMKDQGYDAIKVYQKLSLPVYDEIIRCAKLYNIPVVGHVPSLVDLDHAIKSGQLSIEHFTGYNLVSESDEIVDLTVQSGVYNCPTFVVFDKMRNTAKLNNKIPEFRFVHPDLVKRWAMGGVSRPLTGYELLKTLVNKGARIVSGTDCGNYYVISGFSLQEELGLMQDAGLTPYQVLVTTTVNPAKMLGIADRLGTVEPGKDANLVLLDKNPLDDVRNTKTIEGVMVKGLWLSKEELQKMLEDLAKSYKK